MEENWKIIAKDCRCNETKLSFDVCDSKIRFQTGFKTGTAAEHMPRNQEVAGLNPSWHWTFFFVSLLSFLNLDQVLWAGSP